MGLWQGSSDWRHLFVIKRQEYGLAAASNWLTSNPIGIWKGLSGLYECRPISSPLDARRFRPIRVPDMILRLIKGTENRDSSGN
ncbi:glycoside hydrolase family 18 protein [Moniliophthora roreri]|nr:glycoside hydrolase family 18 protein [Moniliophthora roreri]